MRDWIEPEWPAPPGVRALITTRHGGVSGGPCSSFNVAVHVGDDARAVAENRARLRRHLPDEPLWLDQVHGTAVVRADQAEQGAQADAAVTRRPRRVCAVMTADCLPLLLCDVAGTVVGIAHAGWRGLAAGVIEATVRAMEHRGTELLAYLGPAIGPASFEVGAEVRAAFLAHDARASDAFVDAGEGKFLADIYRLARQRLADAGVRAVFGGGLDTFAETQRFFSFRRDRGAGRMASLIWLA